MKITAVSGLNQALKSGPGMVIMGGVKQSNVVRLALVLLAVCWSMPVISQVYKYTDADGVIHYTNVKPDGVRDYKTFNFPCYVSDPKCHSIDWEKIPLNTRAFRDEIRTASAQYAVDESLIRAIIHAESAYQPDAVSPKGAQGLMQLTPDTQAELQLTNPYNPERNIDAGTYYLAQMLEAFEDDVELAAAAYNAGPTAIRDHGGMPPYPETREYVRRVKILYRRYRLAGA